MASGRLRILHAIHDFLPRHRAGSEIYAFELGRRLAARHHVHVVCADFNPAKPHGQVSWRVHEGLPVIELVNNWVGDSFADTYRPRAIRDALAHVLHAVQPDVVHVHNLLNLTFDLPAMARAAGAAVAATLHDYTLVCPSGGQRIHQAETHVCEVIDPERCARCFQQSPFYGQMSVGRGVASSPGTLGRFAVSAARSFPLLARRAAGAIRHVRGIAVTAADINQRLAAARAVFDDVDVFVAPSDSLATELAALGLDRGKIQVSDYGFRLLARRRERTDPPPRLRFGFVGTLVWHKGVHVLIDAVRRLPQSSFTLTLFGDVNVFPDYVSRLRRAADGLPVHFAGAFDRAAVDEVYERFDVLVVPSLWLENSPLVIHEAFMAGVPVVAARMGGIPGLVEHGRSGLLCEANSSEALAATLQQLIDQPALLAELRQGLPSVKSIEQDARDWEETYQRLVRRRTSSAPTRHALES